MIPVIEAEIDSADPWAEDILDRKPIAVRLTRMIQSIDRPLVLGLTAPWGTGKTVFLRKWTYWLRMQGIETLYFNAWKTDFASDPLIALVSEFDAYFSMRIKQKKGAFEKGMDNALNRLGKVTAAVAPLLGKVATRGMIDAPEIEGALKELADAWEDPSLDWRQVQEILGTTSKPEIQGYIARKCAVPLFQSNLKYFLSMIDKGNDKTPIVIIIDELDRCRPMFAIELLETIKHLFSVPQVVFVLGMNLDQLCHSVKCLYGEEFEARTYLTRFIDLEYRLPEPTTGKFLYAVLPGVLGDDVQIKFDEGRELAPFMSWVDSCVRVFDLTLRDIIRVLNYFVIVRWQIESIDETYLGYIWFLVAWRYKEPAVFNRARLQPYEQRQTFRDMVARLEKEVDDGRVRELLSLLLSRAYLSGGQVDEFYTECSNKIHHIRKGGSYSLIESIQLAQLREITRTRDRDYYREVVDAIDFAVHFAPELEALPS